MMGAQRAVQKARERQEERIERAYQLGLLHGINAQSMSKAKLDVMEFDDYGWAVDGD